MAELTSEMMNNWCSCLNITTSALEMRGLILLEFKHRNSLKMDQNL